jgi:hypothetical protein
MLQIRVIYNLPASHHDAPTCGETTMPQASQPAVLNQNYGKKSQSQKRHQEEAGR